METTDTLYCASLELHCCGNVRTTNLSDIDELNLFQRIENLAATGVRVSVVAEYCTSLPKPRTRSSVKRDGGTTYSNGTLIAPKRTRRKPK